ncbi:localisation of periplasmic protein complexes [Geobacter sp. OR-1]|uniref:AMIN domain-containing protein n=1 Tax=Geobacter sp. OR-1 TaxID=1266765 RepID=UPI0005436ECB|nr:AMIN domain-containing protein [Geobacter sp. OR-1]GAM08966.1 localisation of periplasmic protein complexes [Geobacter sp. OR-1]
MRYGMVCFAALLVLMASAASSLAATATIGSIKFTQGGSRIEIQGDQPLTYLYRKMTGGSGIMLDIAPGKTRGIVGEIPGAGPVTGIWVKELQVDGIPVTRLVIGMEKEVAVTVNRDTEDSSRLLVIFPSLAAPGSTVPGDPALTELLESQKKPVVEKALPRETKPASEVMEQPPQATVAAEVQPKIEPKKAPVQVATPAPQPARPLPLLSADSPVIGRQLQSVVIASDAVEIVAGGTISQYDAFKLSGPERLVVDIPGAGTLLTSRELKVGKFGVSRLRIGVYADKVRLVFDAANPKAGLPLHIIQKTAQGLRITFAAVGGKR